MRRVTEAVLPLSCEGTPLVGVLAYRDAAASTGVVIVVGGPQYRAGAHRQFVLLARALAAAGFPALRFDVRGMGDSEGETRSFEALDDDIAAAVDGLMHRLPSLSQVVLWGLCDGASAALMYQHRRRDSRVRGLCLANPWVRSSQTMARTHLKHYYRDRLRQRDFWAKLLSGRVAWSGLKGLWNNVQSARRTADTVGSARFQEQMAAGWKRFGGDLLLLLSGRDYTAKEFTEALRSDPAWQGADRHPELTVRELPEADHTFSACAARVESEAATVAWLTEKFGTPAPQHGARTEPLKEGST
jgi:exosortase A-associated hydrolase 1